LDLLLLFGHTHDDVLIKKGTDFLLDTQAEDGTWDTLTPHTHTLAFVQTTMKAIVGLREKGSHGDVKLDATVVEILKELRTNATTQKAHHRYLFNSNCKWINFFYQEKLFYFTQFFFFLFLF
jgi:hypothetical protein